MTRLEQALRWWRNNVKPGEWKPHKEIPYRHVRLLRRANLLKYKYELYWNLDEPRDSVEALEECPWRMPVDPS